MTDQLNIQISAFVDNELLDQECELLIRRLCADDELRDTVSRYALIGDVLRGDNLAVRSLLTQRISQALEGNHESLETAAMAAPMVTSGRWQRFLKPIAGVAVAATVAAVALFSLQGFNSPGSGPLPSTTVAVWDTADGSPDLRPVDVPRFTQIDVRPASGMPQSRMDQYLIRHKSYASGLGSQSIMGFRDMGLNTVVPVKTVPKDGTAKEMPVNTPEHKQ